VWCRSRHAAGSALDLRLEVGLPLDNKCSGACAAFSSLAFVVMGIRAGCVI
jgi:hypothetical protein